MARVAAAKLRPQLHSDLALYRQAAMMDSYFYSADINNPELQMERTSDDSLIIF